jgi:hypothetical protein
VRQAADVARVGTQNRRGRHPADAGVPLRSRD